MEEAAPILPQPEILGIMEYGELPETSGVYAVFHGQECLYVGQSKNMHKRWQLHEKRSACEEIYRALTFGWIVAPLADLRVLERRTVEVLRPQFNIYLKPEIDTVVPYEKDIFTMIDVARRLIVTEKRVRTLIARRQLSAVRIGREWRIREQDIQTFIQRYLSMAI